MNKISKVSLTALCGSLAALTAVKAGELTISGSAVMTMSKKSGATSGNPIGMKSNLTFSGNGELDGGQKVSLNITHNDKNVYSSSDMKLTTNSLGSFALTQGTGGAGIGGYDDNMPRAFEEAWDTGVGSGVDLAKGVGSSTTIAYTTPSLAGTTLQIAYAGKNDQQQVNDKSGSGIAGGELAGAGIDVVIDSSQDFGFFAPQIFVGYSETEQDSDGVAGGDPKKNRKEGVIGTTVSVGPIKAGWQRTAEYTGLNEGDSTVFGYKNTSWGVSFNVNDDLSVSYSEFESIKGFSGGHSNAGGERPTTTIESIQAAYTMGGVGLKVAFNDLDNGTYTVGTGSDAEHTLVRLSLAF
jgi:hypothetical protein